MNQDRNKIAIIYKTKIKTKTKTKAKTKIKAFKSVNKTN